MKRAATALVPLVAILAVVSYTLVASIAGDGGIDHLLALLCTTPAAEWPADRGPRTTEHAWTVTLLATALDIGATTTTRDRAAGRRYAAPLPHPDGSTPSGRRFRAEVVIRKAETPA